MTFQARQQVRSGKFVLPPLTTAVSPFVVYGTRWAFPAHILLPLPY
jgi:hypothetical protein